jgi:copper(I)-binding protein
MSIDRGDLLHSLSRSAAVGAILAVTTCATAGAHEYQVGAITVEHPWLRSPGDSGTTAPLFMIIENKGDAADKLIGAKAAKVGKVVLRADPARIVQPHGIVVPPHATVTLQPGGEFVDLREVTKINPVGWGFELTLVFEKAGEVTVDASVEAPDARQAHDAEATERWEKAHGTQKLAEPAVREEHHEHGDHDKHHDAHADDAHVDHEHAATEAHEDAPNEAHERAATEAHEHVAIEAREPASEGAPDVAGMDHSKLNHGVLGHAPSASQGD